MRDAGFAESLREVLALLSRKMEPQGGVRTSVWSSSNLSWVQVMVFPVTWIWLIKHEDGLLSWTACNLDLPRYW